MATNHLTATNKAPSHKAPCHRPRHLDDPAAAKRGDRICVVTDNGMSPPTGDGINDILFDAVPVPLWSRASQVWAFERLSYSHGHIDDA